MTELPAPDQITCGRVCEMYLKMGTKDISPAWFDIVKPALKEFGGQFGERRVIDCRAVELLAYMQAHEHLWKSAWTRLGRLAAIKRAFNWAWDIGLINANPFMRVKVTGPRTRRKPMSDEHYQSILRNSPPAWRRFVVFLRFTGARTAEGSALRWRHIDLARGVAVLLEHKTAKKTGKPRIIPLSPVVVKLLVWMRTHRQASVTGLLEKFLANGPKRIKEVCVYMQHYGASARAMHRARICLGVEKIRVGGNGPKGYYEYRLPDNYIVPADPTLSDLVFTTSRGYPLNKSNMNCYIRRLRNRGVIPLGVSLYCLRHAYGTRGIKNGVAIKLVSLAMGHASVETTEIYIDENSLDDEVAKAVLQINHGINAEFSTAAPKPIEPPRMVEMPTYGAPIGEMNTTGIFLPSRSGDKSLPVVPVDPDAQRQPATPQPTNETLMSLLLQKLSEVNSPKRTRTVVPPDSLTPSQQAAWDAYYWAIGQDPALTTATDPVIFHWLKQRADCPYVTPPMQDTFRRYISAARLLFDQRKRILTERKPLEAEPPTPGTDDKRKGETP